MRDIDAQSLIAGVIEAALAAVQRRPLVVGLCGAQGSGKSTIAAALTADLNAGGVSAATLSLDDLYLGKAERMMLANTVHPLLRTRGVPGTHDVALGLALLDMLDRGEAVRLPRFDKAHDNRARDAAWTAVPPGLKVLLFEGWCVGAMPQPSAALAETVNVLERDEDADGGWRQSVNAALGRDYQRLFARLDRLVLLAAPSFDAVYAWRQQQERQLSRDRAGPGIMSDVELHRFVAHYERLTRHILSEMPGRADLTIYLDADRLVTGTLERSL